MATSAQRDSRYFGRQFRDCVLDEPRPEPIDLNRNRLAFKYPKPASNQDMKIWRHPDYLIPPVLPPAAPAHNAYFTHLCYDAEHVDMVTKAVVEADKHPLPFSGRNTDFTHLCYKRKHIHFYGSARFRHPIPWELPAQPIDNSFTHLCYEHQGQDHSNNKVNVPYLAQSNLVASLAKE